MNHIIKAKVVSWKGHEEKEWDPSKPGDLVKMKEFFKDKLKAGFRAFAIMKDGTSEPITEFNEETEKIILRADKVSVFQPARGG